MLHYSWQYVPMESIRHPVWIFRFAFCVKAPCAPMCVSEAAPLRRTHDFLLWGVKDRVLPYAFSFCEVFLRSYKNIKKYTHFSVLYEEYYRFIFATVLKLILLNILRYTKQTTLPLQWFLVITIWSCLPREYRPDVKLISPIFWRARPFIRQWWVL